MITVRPDNTTVISMCEYSTVPACYEALSTLLIALVSYVRSRHTLVFDHVQGHNLNPWNDLSDNVAKWAGKEGGMEFTNQDKKLITTLEGGQQSDWAWMYHKHLICHAFNILSYHSRDTKTLLFNMALRG